MPLGATIAIAELADCLKINGRVSLKIGDYAIGRYAWILDNVQQIKPVPAKGKAAALGMGSINLISLENSKSHPSPG